MKILYAIQGVERTSGVSLFVVEMLKGLVARGHECSLLYSTVFEVGDLLPKEVVTIQSDDVAEVLNREHYDLIHMHGLWSPFNRRIMLACHKVSIPFVVSPHGCLMPGAMKKGFLKKIIFFFFFLRPLMRRAALVHVTTEAERIACERMGLRGRMSEIPLGVEIGPVLNVTKEKIILTLSRISPEKGIDDLLRAWHGIGHHEWRLLIAGPSWRGCREELEKMVADQKITDVEFVGPVFGDNKRRLYARASLFVMPSHTENFGGTVLEALAERTPVIATTDVAWESLAKSGCGWWVGRSELGDALSSAMDASQVVLQEMGEKGHAYVRAHYCWESVVTMMNTEYEKMR